MDRSTSGGRRGARPLWRGWRRWSAAITVAALGLLVFGSIEAREMPVVRRLTVPVADWPAGQPPVTLALLSDLHVSGPVTPPARLARVVARVNALNPDLVLIAGDFVSDERFNTSRFPSAVAVSPLHGLRAPLGIFATLGNHDHGRGATEIAAALERIGVTVLTNQAARAGPLAIGGLDDPFTSHDRLGPTLAALAAIGGVPVIVAHSPDVFPEVPSRVPLVLAGHTHCGQVAPWPVGPIVVPSFYGRRYACGLYREHGHRLVVTAGIGTSDLPLRLGAPPDLWLVTIGPARRQDQPLRVASNRNHARSSA